MKFITGFIFLISILSAIQPSAAKAIPKSRTSTTAISKASHVAVKNATVTASTSGKMVFAHFMVGIVSSYQASDWAKDISLASASGIDGFALNIGADSYTEAQLTLAYNAAASTNFKLFISFDMTSITDPSRISSILKQYSSQSAQFKVDGKPFVSTFVGYGVVDWNSIQTSSGVSIYLVPNWQASQLQGNSQVSGGFSWIAWPNSNNQPIDANMTTASDNAYIAALAGKAYMAPVSPWFFTHFGSDVPYSKNWLFLSDFLWYQRWEEILQLKPDFVEIITWNDFGESHYIGPLHPENPSVYAGPPTDGAKSWVQNMPHDGWRDISQAYITAYKNGASAPVVSKDEIVYYYRLMPKDTTCSSDATGPPTGRDYVEDNVYAVTLLKSPGTLTITSGNNAPKQFSAPAGVNIWAAPMGIGSQQFKLERNGATVLSGTGSQQIQNSCTTYNFNAFVGTVV
ncbi:glycoside hydrolase family 71 protein [Umbelopsis sp. PMI_123]|nr:glycoside hydrolase family 71 protein [Umbelopsis sp. PMI_123]